MMILVQHPRHVSTEEAESWLRDQVDAVDGAGVERASLRRLTSPTLRFSETWTWMVELQCRDAEAAHSAVRNGPWFLLIADLRLLGMRPSVALVEQGGD